MAAHDHDMCEAPFGKACAHVLHDGSHGLGAQGGVAAKAVGNVGQGVVDGRGNEAVEAHCLQFGACPFADLQGAFHVCAQGKVQGVHLSRPNGQKSDVGFWGKCLHLAGVHAEEVVSWHVTSTNSCSFGRAKCTAPGP